MPREPDPSSVSDAPPGELSAVLRAVLALGGTGPSARGETTEDRLGPAWRALADANPLQDAVLARLERDARERDDAAAVIEVASLRALSWSQAGDLDAALEHARRAARMGRTERLPEPEYLAGLTLARMRRLTGRPYLATRIASALRAIAPSAWHPWVDWEITMACGTSDADADTPAARLAAVASEARAGRRAAFDDALATVASTVDGLSFARRDVAWMKAALDPNAPVDDAPPALRSWCEGTSGYAPAPYGLAGLAGFDLAHGTSTGVGLVVARPDGPGRRILRVAEGLAREATGGRWLGDATVGRTEAILSALALRGPGGGSDAEIFADAYGFAFSPAVHRGAFDVALHRARSRVEPLGRIDRTDGQIELVIAQPFVVPDPRSVPGTDDRLLAHLATTGATSARDLASGLGVPLRTVQDALRLLVEGGACRRDRSGRQILYAIEDTTFQEPTDHKGATQRG